MPWLQRSMQSIRPPPSILNLLDARFNAVSETYGNGLWLQNGYDALTGLPATRKSGTGGLEDNVQNLAYAWDAVGNLTGRSDLSQSLSETFQYDALDRLTQATGPGAQATSVGYDAIGNLTAKSGVGSNFAYHPTKKHALTSAGGTVYGYDGNGNLTSRGGATVAWSSANYPTTIGDPNGYSAQFSYAPDRSRWRQVSTYAGATETTVYVGGLLQKFTNAVTTHWKHIIPTPSGEVQVIRRANGNNETLYVTTDHLGSTDAVLNSAGAVVLRASFAVQGERRASDWQGVPPPVDWQAIAGTTRRGYTGHEALDNVMLVHMNGRVYDPRIGRFLSADPFIDGADTTQGWNRYSYVHNNPLNATDPTGFLSPPGSVDNWTPGSSPGLDWGVDWGLDGPSRDSGPLFWGDPHAYIYGSRIPEHERDRMRNSVLAQRASDLYAGQYVGSTEGGLFFEPIPEPYPPIDGPDLATAGGLAYGSMNMIGDGLAYSNRMWGHWRGRNGLWYSDTWQGNGSTGGRSIAFSRAASWKLIGNVGATVSVMVSVGTIVQAIDDGRPGDAVKPAFDIGMVGFGATTGPPGWLIGSTYFLIDATIHWGPALNSLDQNIRENQAILGPTWSPFRD